MEEVLKIKTYLLSEELEGNGSWGYIDPETREKPFVADGNGYWIPYEGDVAPKNQDVFLLDTLELESPRTMAPMSMMLAKEHGEHIMYQNLVLLIDYDGIVEVETEDPSDTSLRLAYSTSDSQKPQMQNWTEENSFRTNAPLTINVCPIGKELAVEGTHRLVLSDTLVGKEYTIHIRAYQYDGTPTVTAELKLVSIPDPEYPWQTIHNGEYGELFSSNEERTRFCSIELISYTYSEMYILRGEAGTIE